MRYVYLLKDPITKSIVWVGETSNPAQRFNQHCWGLKNDSEDKKEWLDNLKKYGMKPVFEIIDTADTKSNAIIKENDNIVSLLKKGVKLFNQRNTKTLKQYNALGVIINEFANTALAKKITGIRPRTDRCTAGGYLWSYGDFDKTTLNEKENSKKVLCKKVMQIDNTGKLVAEFDGVRIACKLTGIDHRSISQVAAGSKTRKTAGGYLWKYKTESNVS